MIKFLFKINHKSDIKKTFSPSLEGFPSDLAKEVFYLLGEMGEVCGATPMEMKKWQIYLE